MMYLKRAITSLYIYGIKIQLTTAISSLLVIGIFSTSMAQTCEGDLSVNIIGSETGESININLATSAVKCTDASDGNIDVSVNGGNPNFSYDWNTGSASENLNDIPVGIYTVTVTDVNDCSSSSVIALDYLSVYDTEIAEVNTCASCQFSDGTSSFFFSEDGDYIGGIEDIQNNGVQLGETQICVSVNDTAEACDDIPYLSRNWRIEVNNNDNACVKLYFTEAELSELLSLTDFDDLSTLINNLCVTAFDGGGEVCSDHVSATVYSYQDGLSFTPDDPEVGVWSLEVCVPGFSTFFCHVCDPDNPTILPVELLDFIGWHESGTNKLKWNTASELNTSHFEIQRSDDGINFTRIGEVSAQGTTVISQVYHFDDKYPTVGQNYYRLKIIDFDESYEYSDIVRIDLPTKAPIRVFPNPFSAFFVVEHYSEIKTEGSILIYHTSGKEVHRSTHLFQKGNNRTHLNVKQLPAGTYWVKLYDSDISNAHTTFKISKIN